MLTPKLCLVAESAALDREVNEIAAFNILDDITAQGTPVIFTHLAFLVIWNRLDTDPARYEGTFTLRLNDQQITTAGVTVDFAGGRSHRTLVRINGVVFQQPGLAEFKITIAPNVTATYFLTLRQGAPPLAQQARPN
jgi:hypothetical protein